NSDAFFDRLVRVDYHLWRSDRLERSPYGLPQFPCPIGGRMTSLGQVFAQPRTGGCFRTNAFDDEPGRPQRFRKIDRTLPLIGPRKCAAVQEHDARPIL